MNQNAKYSALLDFVARVSKLPCNIVPEECISCDAVALLREVTRREDAPVDTGE